MIESEEFAKFYDDQLLGRGSAIEKKIRYRDEEKIRRDIYQSLGEESGIDLIVEDGLVEVSGLVDTEETIEWVEDKIKDIKGVIGIKNSLRYKSFNH